MSMPKILLTRNAQGNAVWEHELQGKPVEVHSLATIATKMRFLNVREREVLQKFLKFDGIIFTSAAAVGYIADMLRDKYAGPQTLPPAYVVGEKTAEAARAQGFTVVFVALQSSAVDLADTFPEPAGKRLLWPHTTIAATQFKALLEARGAHVEAIALYETNILSYPAPQTTALLRDHQLTHIVFASPSGVRGFRARVGEEAFANALSLPALALGARTAEYLESIGFHDVRPAPEATIEAIVNGIL